MNSMNTIQSIQSTHIVKDILNETIDDILTKWFCAILGPTRLVMIKMDWCYICDTIHISNKCSTHTFDSPTGHSIYGWTYCKKCKIYNKLIDLYYYKNYTSFIRKKYLKHLINTSFSFYRKSSSNYILPYIEHHGGYNYEGTKDFIFLDTNKNKLCVTIGWDLYVKNISLVNLIFYNRPLFGYEYDSFPIKRVPRLIHPFLKENYRYCKEWHTLDCIFYYYKHNIPFDIQKIIFKYWNNLFIL